MAGYVRLLEEKYPEGPSPSSVLQYKTASGQIEVLGLQEDRELTVVLSGGLEWHHSSPATPFRLSTL